MEQKILQIKNLSKKYKDGFKLDIKEMIVYKDKILTLIGPNGSGKSTLFYLLNLLIMPDFGTALFSGKDIFDKSINKDLIRKKMAVVFQEPILFNASVFENIIYGKKLRKEKFEDYKDRLYFLARELKIEHLLKRNPGNLSLGEKQKICLARALLLEPELLLLDEPLSNIDASTKEEFMYEFFSVLKESGTTIIYITHDRHEAMIISDYVGLLMNGSLVQYGRSDEVFAHPVNEEAAKFLGIETLLKGTIYGCKNEVLRVSIENKNTSSAKDFANHKEVFVFASGRAEDQEKVLLSIRAEDVILFKDLNEGAVLSALNIFKGVVNKIINYGILRKVEIDCGFNLVSYITESSIQRLGIREGENINAAIKASAINVMKLN